MIHTGSRRYSNRGTVMATEFPANQSDEDGFSLLDFDHIEPDAATLLREMLRQRQLTLAEATLLLNQPEAETLTLLDSLIEQGLIRRQTRDNRDVYRIQLKCKPRRKLPGNLWSALES